MTQSTIIGFCVSDLNFSMPSIYNNNINNACYYYILTKRTFSISGDNDLNYIGLFWLPNGARYFLGSIYPITYKYIPPRGIFDPKSNTITTNTYCITVTFVWGHHKVKSCCQKCNKMVMTYNYIDLNYTLQESINNNSRC